MSSGTEIYYMEYSDFFDFLAKVALGVWEEDEADKRILTEPGLNSLTN